METSEEFFKTGFERRIFYDGTLGEPEKFYFGYTWRSNSNPGYEFINEILNNEKYKKEDLKEVGLKNFKLRDISKLNFSEN